MGNDTGLRFAYADCDFGQIHYGQTTVVKATGRTPLLLLNPRSRSCWRLLSLVEADRLVVVVDVPAYGASSPPTRACTMHEVAKTVVALMDSLGISEVHVCGWHTGAKVASAIVADWPERVRSLTVCGKSHSLIPDHDRRNQAIRDQVASQKPDVMLIGIETLSIDDHLRSAGRNLVYDANFAFDLSAAISSTNVPVLVIEITSVDEDQRHGRQGKLLAGLASRGHAIELPEVEQTGIDLYVGTDVLAPVLISFIGSVE